MDPIDPGFGGGCGPCGHGHHHHHHGHQISPFGPGPNVSPFGPGPNVSPFYQTMYHQQVQISDQTLVEYLKSK